MPLLRSRCWTKACPFQVPTFASAGFVNEQALSTRGQLLGLQANTLTLWPAVVAEMFPAHGKWRTTALCRSAEAFHCCKCLTWRVISSPCLGVRHPYAYLSVPSMLTFARAMVPLERVGATEQLWTKYLFAKHKQKGAG
jgi:hypothetical protein